MLQYDPDDFKYMTRHIIKLSDKEWTKFYERLNEPPKENPKLKKLLEEKCLWDDDESK